LILRVISTKEIRGGGGGGGGGSSGGVNSPYFKTLKLQNEIEQIIF
jgi:hypothetical protein